MIKNILKNYETLFGNKQLPLCRSIKEYIFNYEFKINTMINVAFDSDGIRKKFWITKLKKYQIYIGENAKCGYGLSTPHPTSIVIGKNVSIGNKCEIYQNVTIGNKNGFYPTIGNEVKIYPNVLILGNVHIGDNVKIGGGSVVLKDIPSNATVVGNPARIIKEDKIE